MAGAYSQDLRNRVIETISYGASCRAAAARYAAGASTAVNWRRRLETGSAAAKPMGGATNNRIKGEDAVWLLAAGRDE